MSDLNDDNKSQAEQTNALLRVSRRGFLKAAGILAAAASVGACEATAQQPSPTPTEIPVQNQYPEVPYPPAQPLPENMLTFFSPDEARTVDALVSRILPGSPDDPGAHEAGVVNYIDKTLGFFDGFDEPTYRQAPYAQAYEGDKPPAEDKPQYQVVSVKKDELLRYGFQSIQTPREMYRLGVASVNHYAMDKFKKKFADLSPDQQDQIVADMADDKATGFEHPSGKEFFTRLRNDTINGMFSDPAYGGNKDMVGWTLIGYPGAQRAYTPHDLKTEQPPRPPQSLAMMHDFHPGEPANPNVVLPVSGSDQHRPQH